MDRVKNIQQRVKTTDSTQIHTYTSPNNESYRQLQFRYKSLQHQYSILENQFQLYSSETFNKIQGLQRDMDNLVGEKDKIIKSISLQNKNLKQENTKLKSQISNLHTQNEKVIRKMKQNEQQFRDSVFNHQKIQSRQREIVMNYQRQLEYKINQLQSIKQILNTERIHLMNKDQIIYEKENQIAQLSAQVKNLHYQLKHQQQIQDQIKDCNYRLKKQLQQLTSMFAQMESGLRNCDMCKILELKNIELTSVIKNLQQKQNKKELYSFSRQNNKKKVQRKAQVSMPKKRAMNKYYSDLSYDEMYSDHSLPQRNLKDSVVKRCRLMLDKS